MGWKAACIVTGDCDYGYLATRPAHDPQRAIQLVKTLGYFGYSKHQTTDFDPYPEPGTFAIGAYANAVLVADQDQVFNCMDNRHASLFKKMLALYPTGKLLGFALQSVSDYFAYVYYENGKLVREYSGASEMGMIFDSGDPQREEMQYYENSEFIDGERVFSTKSGTETYQEKGETMGMLMIHDICKKFFGKPLDQSLDIDGLPALQVELFTKRKLGEVSPLEIGILASGAYSKILDVVKRRTE